MSLLILHRQRVALLVRESHFHLARRRLDCHGGLEEVANNPESWLNEPRCDNEVCHGSAYQQDQALYRQSSEHGDIYCAACHDSPHAIALSAETNDSLNCPPVQNQGRRN